MPTKGAVLGWVADDREGFSDQYEKACTARAHHWADELLDIADDGSNDWMERTGKDGEPGWVANGEAIQRSRLRVDARKWLLSKMLPKKYSEKSEIDHKSSDGSMSPTRIEIVAGQSDDDSED